MYHILTGLTMVLLHGFRVEAVADEILKQCHLRLRLLLLLRVVFLRVVLRLFFIAIYCFTPFLVYDG